MGNSLATISGLRESWDQLDHETEEEFDLFHRYQYMQPPRSIEKLAEDQDLEQFFILKLAERNFWDARVDEWTRRVREIAESGIDDELRTQVNRLQKGVLGMMQEDLIKVLTMRKGEELSSLTPRNLMEYLSKLSIIYQRLCNALPQPVEKKTDTGGVQILIESAEPRKVSVSENKKTPKSIKPKRMDISFEEYNANNQDDKVPAETTQSNRVGS